MTQEPKLILKRRAYAALFRPVSRGALCLTLLAIFCVVTGGVVHVLQSWENQRKLAAIAVSDAVTSSRWSHPTKEDSTAELASMFPISMVKILTQPEKYAGKTIRVEGDLHLRFEDERLYFTKEHADGLSSENAIDLEVPTDGLLLQPSIPNKPQFELNCLKPKVQYFDDKLVMLEGRFDSNGVLHVVRIMELEH